MTNAYNIFPTSAPQDVISGMMTVIGDNIAPILALLGLAMGISFVVARFGSAKNGRI